MKAKSILLMLCMAGTLFSCKNAEPLRDVLYFTGTEKSIVAKYTVDGPAEIGVTVSASCLANVDHKIKIKADPDKLLGFNEENGKNYKIVPFENFMLSSGTVQLKAGQNVSEPLIFSLVKSDNFEEGATYCMPLTITEVLGDLEVLEASRTIYLVLGQTLVTQAADLKDKTYYKVPFKDDVSLSSLQQCSMEARVFIHEFDLLEPYISTVIGIEENFVLRFGDVNIEPDQLHLAGGGYQVTGQTKFEKNKWYHVAVVYDGSEIRLYVNGQLDGSIAAPRGNINLCDDYSGGFHVGYSVDNRRRLNGAISEARVWKKALSVNEIQNNMCFLAPENYKDLIAYWRFNDGSEATVIKDWSGNGWDLKASGGAPEWMEGVRCPE